MRLFVIAVLAATLESPIPIAVLQAPTTASTYVAYYWRAKPGQIDAYNEYIKTVAVPIDEDARRAGAFEEVHTVTPMAGTTTDWTHLRIFRVKSADAARTLGAALDAATARIVPDEAKRKANSERAATLRDFVRQEMWSELK
jgi:hypothetical protein